MRTTNRFDPAAFKVPEMSPENESETSANGEKSKTLVFSYLRVSLLGKVKSGRFYLAMFQHYHLPVFALGMLEKSLYICSSSQDGKHICESVFVSFVGNSQFQRQRDYDNHFRSCIDYAVSPVLGGPLHIKPSVERYL